MNAKITTKKSSPSRDLLRTWSALWLWCLPILGLIVANNLYADHRLSFSVAGVAIVVASFWIGAACYANGRSCGRLHCKIDGYALPLLGLVGLADLIHLVSFGWSTYTNVLTIVVVLSFVAEYLDNRVHHKGSGRTVC